MPWNLAKLQTISFIDFILTLGSLVSFSLILVLQTHTSNLYLLSSTSDNKLLFTLVNISALFFLPMEKILSYIQSIYLNQFFFFNLPNFRFIIISAPPFVLSLFSFVIVSIRSYKVAESIFITKLCNSHFKSRFTPFNADFNSTTFMWLK